MKLLVLFAHPRLSGSVVQQAMLAAIAGLDGVTIHDLYAAYPDFAIDVAAEQHWLLAHDVIVLQHPFYWYSSPAIIKEWQDLVLENGWAYGPGGTRLRRKFLLSALSTGGTDRGLSPARAATVSQWRNSWLPSTRPPISAPWPISNPRHPRRPALANQPASRATRKSTAT